MKPGKLRQSLQHFGSIVGAVLREIFDESAYDRFLLRTKSRRSSESYSDFMQARETAIAQRPKCC
jgi:hypothetical protein